MLSKFYNNLKRIRNIRWDLEKTILYNQNYINHIIKTIKFKYRKEKEKDLDNIIKDFYTQLRSLRSNISNSNL